MPAYGPGDLDILARAWDRALEAIPRHEPGTEAMKAIVLMGILDAAKTGLRNEGELAVSGLNALGVTIERSSSRPSPGEHGPE